MTDDVEKIPTPEEYRLGILDEIERVKKQQQLIVRTLESSDEEIAQLVALSIRFGTDTLPTIDAPPIVVAIMRSEFARALAHLKRGGRCARRLGLDVDAFAVAIRALRAGIQRLPRDLPKRRIP